MPPNEKPTSVITIDEDEFDFDNLTEEIERVLAQADTLRTNIKEPPTLEEPKPVKNRWRTRLGL
jgi:hypothetical protein